MDDLKNKSDQELAQWQAGWKPSTDKYILAEIEWANRAREKQHQLDQALLKSQHDLNLIILDKQSKLTKLAISVGFIGVLVGALLGAYMQSALSTNNSHASSNSYYSESNKIESTSKSKP
ncbi:hypothetical protein A3197_21550 [Candidatus Thiodiazotropha endoloripes]|nr:hypothetical protein A3197_21550 [Candidatus Thiodiazotropha endoloripes]